MKALALVLLVAGLAIQGAAARIPPATPTPALARALSLSPPAAQEERERERARAGARGGSDLATQPVHFAAIDIYLDPQGRPLAAYQFEFTAKEGQIKVVGVENGAHPAFRQPPYCDRAAIGAGRADRIIVAAFNTAPADGLPTAKTRVTTIHLQYTGDTPPQYAATLTVAATADSTRIPAQLTFSEGP